MNFLNQVVLRFIGCEGTTFTYTTVKVLPITCHEGPEGE